MPPADPRSPSPTRHCSVQSLPETVQVPRPPGIWTVPGAFFLRLGRRGIGGRRVSPIVTTCLRLRPPSTPKRSSVGSWQPCSSGGRSWRRDRGRSTTTFVAPSWCWRAFSPSSASGTPCLPVVADGWPARMFRRPASDERLPCQSAGPPRARRSIVLEISSRNSLSVTNLAIDRSAGGASSRDGSVN